ALGQNPNLIANIWVLGLLTLLGVTYGGLKSALRRRFLTWPLFILLAVTIVRTGSRGALLALGVGLLAFVLRGETLWMRLRNVALVLIGIGFFVLLAYRSGDTRSRFQTLGTGDLAGRERIYPASWETFYDQPLLGWGPVYNEYEIAARI